MDAALLARAHADGLSVIGEAHGVRLGIFEGDQRNDQVAHGGFRQVLVGGHHVPQQLRVDFEIVAALLKGDAEHLLALLRIGHEIGIDLHDVVIALALGFEDLQRFGLVAGGDDAVGHLALDHLRGGHVAHVAERHPVAEGAHAVGAAGAGVGAGQRAVVQALDIIHKAGFPELFGQGDAHGGAGGRHMLEARHGGQAQGGLQFLYQLPAVEGVQEVDIARASAEDPDGQVASVVHVDFRGLLVGVAAVLQFKFLHRFFPHLFLFTRRFSVSPVLRSTVRTYREILLSAFRAFQISSVISSISLPTATRSGSPWKVGMGLPSCT